MQLKTVYAAFAVAGLLAVAPELAATDLPRGPATAETLGSVEFPVSCTPEAQRHFTRAQQLYHNFYGPEARKAFDAVLQSDPGCAMGHWGHAMVVMDNPFQWPLRGKALGDGWARIEKARALGPKTERESLYIAAVEAFFRNPEGGVDRTRQLAYEVAMDALARRYPSDTEAQILHALAVSANFDPNDKGYTNQKKAAASRSSPGSPTIRASPTTSCIPTTIRRSRISACRRRTATPRSPRPRRMLSTCLPTSSRAWARGTTRSFRTGKLRASPRPRIRASGSMPWITSSMPISSSARSGKRRPSSTRSSH